MDWTTFQEREQMAVTDPRRHSKRRDERDYVNRVDPENRRRLHARQAERRHKAFLLTQLWFNFVARGVHALHHIASFLDERDRDHFRETSRDVHRAVDPRRFAYDYSFEEMPELDFLRSHIGFPSSLRLDALTEEEVAALEGLRMRELSIGTVVMTEALSEALSTLALRNTFDRLCLEQAYAVRQSDHEIMDPNVHDLEDVGSVFPIPHNTTELTLTEKHGFDSWVGQLHQLEFLCFERYMVTSETDDPLLKLDPEPLKTLQLQMIDFQCDYTGAFISNLLQRFRNLETLSIGGMAIKLAHLVNLPRSLRSLYVNLVSLENNEVTMEYAQNELAPLTNLRELQFTGNVTTASSALEHMPPHLTSLHLVGLTVDEHTSMEVLPRFLERLYLNLKATDLNAEDRQHVLSELFKHLPISLKDFGIRCEMPFNPLTIECNLPEALERLSMWLTGNNDVDQVLRLTGEAPGLRELRITHGRVYSLPNMPKLETMTLFQSVISQELVAKLGTKVRTNGSYRVHGVN